MNYLLHLLILFDVYLITAISLNVVVGYVGLLTLAHAGYFALGAYGYALAALLLGWGFVPSLVAALAVTALASLPLAIASWRFRGDFFVLFSLAVQVLLISALRNWHDPTQPFGTWSNVTNGDFGIMNIPAPAIGALDLGTQGRIALLFTLLATGVAALAAVLLRSPWGRMVRAVRDDELAARGLGKNIHLVKLQGIAIGCAVAGFAGALFASYSSFIDPTLADLDQSTLLLAMIIVGGVGSAVLGPLVGAALLIAIPELLRFVHLPITMAAELRLALYGLLLILFVHARPQGIAGRYRMD
ncbi:MAG: branched-chain amino acid ABC transporter permease [Dongiaceae bacterium]